MSSTQTEFTPVELALGLLEFPSLDGLTEEQVRGFTCIWDGDEKPLAEETAVALGERHKAHPRGCPEHVSHAAMEALFAHCMKDCEVCGRTEETIKDGAVQEPSCEIGVTLRRLVLRRGLR
ncbi:hypothetical protein [Streptomyces violaceus]|uniref:Uncharacterized protein n=1 Tax=Streptomyces violaceus TaxID=1936 RepID=A0ABY9UE83_STRVL|nr:hypothetical protein [Streptomyces janthinus]WND21178.1 hypothetical protein RI060_29270 [Streptomyces janthinus]GGS47620.1 hypothetical protein GCM10010270_17090 [Streptomyces janthinus]